MPINTNISGAFNSTPTFDVSQSPNVSVIVDDDAGSIKLVMAPVVITNPPPNLTLGISGGNLQLTDRPAAHFWKPPICSDHGQPTAAHRRRSFFVLSILDGFKR